ncbi:phage tail protein I [Sphingomonas paucimobilis]|uniref:phage tail protein I n=1 Tax=Sphingomonas paucimobilis TaxID=13689 RepID=UPI003D9651BA
MNSLLPPNATPLMRALEAGATLRPDIDVGALADAVADPMTAPAFLLPWLAYGESVDAWDADWSEADKRAAIANSIAFHRRKGTRASVEEVLSRFDQLARLVEWHEASPRRPAHTFDVIVPMVLPDGSAPGGRRASAAFADAIIREIARVKPLREHMRLVQEIGVAGAVGITGVARAVAYTRTDADMVIDQSPDWAAYLQTEDGEPLQSNDASFLDTRP